MTTFKKVAEFFNTVEQITKRLELREKLTEFLNSLEPQEAAITAYFITGRVAPKFVNAEFAVSQKTIEHILSHLFKIPEDKIKEYKAKYLDYGGIFFNLRKEEQAQKYSADEIYAKLWEIISITGKGSQERKFELITDILTTLSPVEGKFFIRVILGKMRLGISERTILDSISFFHQEQKTAREIAEQAFGLTSDIGYVTFMFAKIKDIEKLKDSFHFTPGIPIAAKLVEREQTIQKIFERIPNAYEEPKYDGLRCQAHIYKGATLKLDDRIWTQFYHQQPTQGTLDTTDGNAEITVKLFSRNLENLTPMFPEIVTGFTEIGKKLFKEMPNAKAFVFDGEVVGYNPNTQEFLPFTETMTRRRKYNVDKAATETPVRIFTFDVLYWNDSNLLNTPLYKRKELLKKIANIKEEIMLTPVHTPRDFKQAEEIFLEFVSEGLEGVIFKDPNSLYTPGLRRFDWIKFKKAMKKELADTIDVVVLGYYYGTGKWAKLGIGALLVGVYDKEKDEYLTITKVGTGIKEEEWIQLKSLADQYKIDHKLPNVNIPKQLMPDVLVEPAVVLEIEADEITKSPIHTAGYALRFPRFKRVRDKAPTDATSLQEILEMVKEKQG